MRTPSTRERKSPDRLTLICMAHITAKRALREDEENARPAIEAELRTMLDKKVFSPVLQSTLSSEQKRRIIRSQLNITQKYLPSSDGQGRTKDRLKARLVGGGDGQDRSIYTESETSSPTVSTTSVLLIAQIAAMERRNVATIDIGSAYLNAMMPTEDKEKIVHMKLSPEVSEILIQMEATYKEFACKDGSIIVQLDRALYGCLQSALLWFKELSKFLSSVGFVPNPYDPCVMNAGSDDQQITIGIYVDDIIITCKSESRVTNTIQLLEKEYKKLKITRGLMHHYLGMVMDFSAQGVVTIDQTGMLEDITSGSEISKFLMKYSASMRPNTPATEMLFNISENSPELDMMEKQLFHSTTAKLLFTANRARPDLVTLVSFLTKRVLHPTVEDAKKLARGVAYIRNTLHIKLQLACIGYPHLQVYIDASFAIHSDKKSHTGVMTTLGRGAMYTKSTTQKINTTSSCESELVALSKGLQQTIWSRFFLVSQGYKNTQLTVYQDNKSTIKLIEKGRPAAEQSRHIDIGFFWVHDLITRGILSVVFCATIDMYADYFTKPLKGTLFQTMLNKIMGQ
jgi:Reverse transcriptase (RNA-dependent DNA polymerase)